ncbi:unnamed protein product [Closterium sp. NIES-53]
MASLSVLTFDHEGRPIQFNTWLDVLQLYLLSDSRDSVSLFDHTSGASLAPPTTANIARYSSLATDALGCLILPYLFPELSAFTTIEDLVTHFRTSDARYRAALPAKFLDRNPPPMNITLYFMVTRLPDSLRAVRDNFLALDPTDLTVDLLEQHLLAAETSVVSIGAAHGTLRTPFFEGMSELLLLLVGRAAAARARVAGVVAVAAGVVVGAVVEVVEVVEVVAAVGVVTGVGALVAAVVAAVGVAVVAAVGVVAIGLELFRGERGAFGGSVRCPYVIHSGDRAGQTCGKPHSQHRCFFRLDYTWRADFGDEANRPCWAELLRSEVDIFALDYDAILVAMYALSASTEGDYYLCVPPEPGIEAAALGATECALPGSAPAEALHTFTLDSSASRCFFHDSTTLTPLPAPVPVRLADPSGGPVLARSSTILPCRAVPSGSLSGLHLPSFSVNLVSTSDAVAAPCSCCLMLHQTLFWHHRLGHPSLPRLRGMHSHLLVSGLPMSLPPLLPSPAPPYLPCVEGRHRVAPHSSLFPPMTAPLKTLHMDVKGEVPDALIPWIRAVRLLLRERFREDLPVLRLHSDRGGEFSSDLLRDFCRGECILQSFTLMASSQQNGIAERRIGLFMEVARTSMIHAAALHFLWPFAVRYAGHQLNLWPRASLQETSPTLHWTGKVDDTSVFRFYHPTSRRVLPSQDVTFDESAPFYRLLPYRSAFLPPPPLFLARGPPPVDPLPPQDPGAARGTTSGGAEPASAEPGGAEPAGAESGSAEPRAAGAGGYAAGGTRAGGAGATSLGGAGFPAGAGGTGGARGAGQGGARTRGTRAAGAGGVGGAGAGGARAGDPSAGGARAGGTGAGGTGAGNVRDRGAGARDLGAEGARARGTGAGGSGAGGARAGGAGAGDPGARGVGAGDAGAVDPRAEGAGAGGAGGGGTGAGGTVLSLPSSTGLPPSLLSPPPCQSQPPLQLDSPLPAPSPCAKQIDSFTERHWPESFPASPVRTGRRVPRPRPPPVLGTHVMALPRAASPTVPRLLATVVTHPSFESSAGSPLVAELAGFAAVCRLDYTTSLVAESESECPPSVGGGCALGMDVLEDRQEDFEFLVAAVPHPVAMLLAPEGDPDAPDIPTPRSYAEALTGPYSSKWQTVMDAEMASLKSTGTYVNAVPPSGANIVDGMWIFRVKRLPGSPPVFKACYRDYEMHSLVWLHEGIWLRRPPGFTGSFLAALGFAPSSADPSLFLRTDTSLPPFYVLVYIDDLVFATADTEALALVNSELQKRHTCTDLGELRSDLGLQITRHRARRTITLTQSHMVHQVLQRFYYSSPQSTPLPTGHSLLSPPLDESIESSGPYPELVGCLMYLMTFTQPDLAYPLSILARFVAPGRHRPETCEAAKRLLRYLCSNSGMGLVLGGPGPVVLIGHTDVSWVDDLATQRSSQVYTFSLDCCSFSWRSTRSSSVLCSSCEAEIYAGAMAAHELRWLTYLLTDLGERPRSSPVLYVDNKAMIALCQEHRLEHITKHIALRYFLAREL